MEHAALQRESTLPGVRHALMVFTSPRALYARVEDTGAYGWVLVTLLGLVMLIGYIQVQSGLIDRSVELRTDNRLRELEESQSALVDRIELKDKMESIRKAGQFERLITRLGVIVLNPIYLLASFLLITSVFYALVALTGRKPEYHTLMSICVYAGFIELAGYVLQVSMMLYYQTDQIDTSLAGLGVPGKPTVLAAIDPFRIWFWVLAAVGLVVTRQLGRRMAVATCAVMCLVAMGARAAMQFAPS